MSATVTRGGCAARSKGGRDHPAVSRTRRISGSLSTRAPTAGIDHVLVRCGVPIPWPRAGDFLRSVLRDRGLDPDLVESTEAAWHAFCAFLATDVDGLDSAYDTEADGFIVQWGRYSWNDKLPTLDFTRQLAVDISAGQDAFEIGRAALWQVSLQIVFPDHPALDQLETRDTGFYFVRTGPQMDSAQREVRQTVDLSPTLRTLWASKPLKSSVDQEQAA
jgi:hypothetical protein